MEGQELTIKNSSDDTMKLMLPSVKSAQRWRSELIETAKEVSKIKANIDLTASVDTEASSQDVEEDETDSIMDLDSVKFAFDFEASRIGLQLITETKNRTSDQNWCLDTQLKGLNVKFEKKYYDQAIDVSIQSLRVSDNSGD